MKSAVLLWHLEALGSKKGTRTMGSMGSSGVPSMRWGWTTVCALPLLVLSLMAAQAGWSQEPKPSGSSSTAQQKVAVAAVLGGHVTGAGGAPIADAEVTVENLVSHQKLSAKTDSGGGFAITNLPAGEFSLTVSKAGFKRFLVNKMPLVVGDQAQATVQMQPGSPNEVVIGPPASVVSRAGTSLAGKDLNDIPENQRNFVNLAQLANGANEGNTNEAASNARPGAQHVSSSVSLGGQQEATNNAEIDSIDNHDRANGMIAVHPSVDVIKEMQISANAYPANLGRAGGGVVDIVTKAGGKSFHGGVFEYFRNDVLNAYPFLFGAHSRKPESRQNQFGGSLGGPLWHGKTYFFGDYEGFHLIEGRPPVTLIVPTAYEHAHPGDFSDVGGPVVTNMDPIGLAYFKLFPLPNSGANSYVASPSGNNIAQTGDLRIDHHFSPRDDFFARYSYDKSQSFIPSAFPDVVEDGITIHPGGQIYTYAGIVLDISSNSVLSYVHRFSPNVDLDLLAGYTFWNETDTDLNPTEPVNQIFGQPGINLSTTSNGLAPINVTTASSLGNSGYGRPLNQLDNVFDYQGALNWVLGKHTLTFGGSLIRRQFTDNMSQYGLGYWTVTSLPNLLEGQFIAVQRSVSLYQPHYRLWESVGWIIDRWKATPQLTFTYGLRYDVFTPETEAQDRLSNFDIKTGAVVPAGTPGVSGTANVRTDYTNIGPRTGFVWQAVKRTTIHGGFGIVASPAADSTGASDKSYPYNATFGTCGSTTNVCPGGYTTLAAGLPAPTEPSLANLTGYLLHARAYGLRNIYLEQFNLGIDQTLSAADVLHVGYQGSLGRHVTRQFPDLNAPPPNTSATPNTLRRYYPIDPNLTSIAYIDSGGASSYNALQVSYAHATTHGLTATFSYTLARGIDNATAKPGGDGNGFGTDIADSNRRDYGNSNADVRHHITTLVSYALPFGEGSHGFTGALAKGWQFNVLEVWGTGLPFTVVNATDVSNTNPGASGADRTNVVGNPNLAQPRVHEFFNTAAFQAQAAGTLGDEARNQLHGPHIRHADVSLFKTLKVHDAITMQFRTECFNLANSANFGAPNASLNGGDFGQLTQITTGYTPREIQFALRLSF